MDQAIFKTLFQRAAQVRENSYSPLSHFKVGAAIKTATGNIYSGTNVEEAAFNSTIHAEQSCVAQMVAAEGHQTITHLVIVSGSDDKPVSSGPCGHCRQILAEFAPDTAEMITASPNGTIRLDTTFGALLPYKFSMRNLSD